ncbi:putative protein tag-76, partial [Trichinella pseudospiralis]
LQIVRTCRSTGIQMPDNPKFYEQAGKNDSVEMVLKRIADKCDKDGIKCDLVFVVLFSSDQYAEVKSCGDITFGLVTQCLLPRTINEVAVKKSYSTMLNIAMKINMKIGGINTKLLKDEILDNYLYKNNTLVIGVDVVHPSAVETHLPSIAAVVANVDVSITKFHASVKIQPAKQELITGFVEQFSERLMEYFEINGSSPKNIIVFRDGVSEGQFMQVKLCFFKHSKNLSFKKGFGRRTACSSSGLQIVCIQLPTVNYVYCGSKATSCSIFLL